MESSIKTQHLRNDFNFFFPMKNVVNHFVENYLLGVKIDMINRKELLLLLLDRGCWC